MEKVKIFYPIMLVIVWLEVLNLTFKLFNAYYFNLLTLSTMILVISVFGLKVGVRKWLVVTFGGLALLLSVLMLFVVWNL